MHNYAVDDMCVKGNADSAIKLTAQSYTIKNVPHNTTTKVIFCHYVVRYGKSKSALQDRISTTGTCSAGLGRDDSLHAEVLPRQQLWKRFLCPVDSSSAVPQGLWPGPE